jgi:PAS domain S-box-containing protein
VRSRQSNSYHSIRVADWARRYLLAVALVILATLLTLKTQPILGEISPLFFAAVAISTWYGGAGPGLLATALAGWASAYFFFDVPAGTGVFGWDDALRLGVFLIVALLMSSLMHFRQVAEDSLKKANDELENRVRERTRELELSTGKVIESEERFRILMEGVADYAIFMLDTEGRVVSWNSGSERIYGYKQAEVCGSSYTVFFSPDDQQLNKPTEQLRRAIDASRNEDEGWRVRKDGSRFWANVIMTPLHDETHTLRGFAHITRDTTELKRLEREILEISDAEQRRIGHDLHDGLGQELTGLAFLSQNLGRRLSGSALQEAAAEAERISMLTNRAIETTRELARGLSPVELGPDGLFAAIRELIGQMQKLSNVRFEMQMDSGVRLEDHAAAVHLYRITQESITNALRHSGASDITVGLRNLNHDVVVSVEDNGIGIPDERVTNSGLGLHLMLYRARMIGAALSVLARPEGGTVVRCIYRNATERSSPSNGPIDGSRRA